MLATREQLDR